ncbi:hypothetical protein N7513_008101 [Penicillium frequentans]|nr:hypothetical protein N7513_008101 [Penicillium glabrum]
MPRPDPTAAEKGGFQLNLPEPTPAPEQYNRKLIPRDNTDDSTLTDYYSAYFDPTTSTSWAAASVCGYIDGLWSQSNSVACGDNKQCVFHTADSAYPGLVGCCDDNGPSSCLYETTCYDAAAVSATPDLTSDSFAAVCTGSTLTACQTWIYPEYSITDYGCAESATTETIYLSGTSILPSTYTGYYYDEYPTVAAVSPSLVDDDWIKAYVSSAAATATTDKTDKASSAATATASADTSNKGSSTNTAAIVGGVVGGVVGAGGIGAAIFMFWMLQKKKRKQQSEDAATGASQPALGGSALPPHATSVIIAPQEVDGDSHQKIAEMDGYTADNKFGVAEVPGSNPWYRPQEMDAKNFVAELPAPHSEQRPLSSNISRPIASEGRRS